MTHYTDLIIERIRQYGALCSVADQYSAQSRVPDEDKRLAILVEAEEVLDSLRDIIDASEKEGGTPPPPTKLQRREHYALRQTIKENNGEVAGMADLESKQTAEKTSRTNAGEAAKSGSGTEEKSR
jgi:hypothetical protein